MWIDLNGLQGKYRFVALEYWNGVINYSHLYVSVTHSETKGLFPLAALNRQETDTCGVAFNAQIFERVAENMKILGQAFSNWCSVIRSLGIHGKLSYSKI